jgi:hypothetical protein
MMPYRTLVFLIEEHGHFSVRKHTLWRFTQVGGREANLLPERLAFAKCVQEYEVTNPLLLLALEAGVNLMNDSVKRNSRFPL